MPTVIDKNSVKCRLCVRQVDRSADIENVTEVFSRRRFCSILGGNDSVSEDNRFSVWAAEPVEVFEFCEGDERPFEKLAEAMSKYKLDKSNLPIFPDGMFCGGWIGYFSYDLNRYIEKVPSQAADDLGMDLMRLCFYDRAVCYDHLENSWRIIGLEIEGEDKSGDEKINELLRLVDEAESLQVQEPPKSSNEKIEVADIRSNMSREYYQRAFERIQKYIIDGDVYQINFAQRFECDFKAEAVKLYHQQNRFNPSPYAAYIDGGDFSIVSSSPEMFISIRNGRITTKPIKGTRPRVTEGEDADARNKAAVYELINSEKEQAELNMIVDLERNDLARICAAGTRGVVQGRTIETFPTVFHAVATVAGRLKKWAGAGDICEVIKGVFPGGSITGAPKIRAMEIIDELEPVRRGVYTGSIGYVGLDGSVCLNIAIRTVIIKAGKAYVYAGGGIVSDSQAESEWVETIVKAKALLSGIKAVNNSKG